MGFASAAVNGWGLIVHVLPSGDRDAAVDRQHLPGHQPRFVAGEVERGIGDIVGLYEAEQVRVGELLQRGVAGNEPLDPLGLTPALRFRKPVRQSANESLSRL